MALRYGFFNSVNGDRKYNAEDMMNPYRGIVSNGVVAHQDKSDGLQVLAKDGLKVVLKAGFGIFAGRWCENDADMELELSQPHVTLSRVDSVIVRVDTSLEARSITVRVASPPPSDSPEPIELTRTDTITEYRLANIIVAPNAIRITQADIEDTRPSGECGFVTNLLQNSDISATYEQWEAQFRAWLAGCEAEMETREEDFDVWSEDRKAAYDAWFSSLTEDLAVSNVGFQTHDRAYTAQADGETEISIGINEFSSSNDVLSVFVNGMRLVSGVDYTVNGYDTITLAKPVDAGTVVSFFLLKTVLTSDMATTMTEMENIKKVIPAEATEENKLADRAYVDSSVPPSDNFTYIVDSSKALEDWADNVAGNDYTKVLIRTGNWGLHNKGINLATTGTAVVAGEAGATIQWTMTNDDLVLFDGSGYSEVSVESVAMVRSSMRMEGVCVVVSSGSLALKNFTVFNGVRNMRNCPVMVMPNSTDIESNLYEYLFRGCTNVENCHIQVYLINLRSLKEVLAYGFYQCRNVSRCSVTVSQDNSINYETSYMSPFPFRECVGVDMCEGQITGFAGGDLFYDCTLVSRCRASGKTNTFNNNGGLFSQCYASNSKTATYACADTANGGFNDLTIPSE